MVNIEGQDNTLNIIETNQPQNVYTAGENQKLGINISTTYLLRYLDFSITDTNNWENPPIELKKSEEKSFLEEKLGEYETLISNERIPSIWYISKSSDLVYRAIHSFSKIYGDFKYFLEVTSEIQIPVAYIDLVPERITKCNNCILKENDSTSD